MTTIPCIIPPADAHPNVPGTVLRDSKRLLQSTLNALSAHIAILDEQGTIIEVNAAWIRFASENDFIGGQHGMGNNYLEVCDSASGSSSEGASAVAGGIRAVMATQRAEFLLEYPCHSPEEQRWFVVRATRFDGDGPVRVAVAHENITERKLAEEALRESELRLAHAMSLAQLVSWEYDVASGLFTFSDRYYALHGTAAELEGGNLMSAEFFARKFMHPDDAHLVADEVAKAVATADPDYHSQLECRILCRNGELRHVVVHIAIAKDAAGRTIHLRGASQDITERKKSEQELRNLWRAMEQTPATVVITNVSGNIEYVNPKFVEITGYSIAEVLGQNPRILKSGLHDASFYKAMWDTVLQGNVWKGEINNKKKNGDLYWESASISPVRNPNGEITHFIAVKEDITGRKLAARQLTELKLNEELSRRALEHERELNQIKSRFVSMVSHEFRTPLGVINTAAHLLGRYTDRMTDEERGTQVQEIQNSVERMTGMMEDLLLHGEFETGKMECKPSRVDVESLCRRLISEVPNHPGAPCPIQCAIDPAAREAVLDEKILRHILGNLLSNAVKYSGDGQQPVTIEVKRVVGKAPTNGDAVDTKMPPQDHLELKVSDSGIGIPAADIAKLFQTFHRAANVGNRPGTGMGLAIVKQYVDLHRGKIRIESEEGKGTTVWVSLPIAPARGI